MKWFRVQCWIITPAETSEEAKRDVQEFLSDLAIVKFEVGTSTVDEPGSWENEG